MSVATDLAMSVWLPNRSLTLLITGAARIFCAIEAVATAEVATVAFMATDEPTAAEMAGLAWALVGGTALFSVSMRDRSIACVAAGVVVVVEATSDVRLK